ncbi:MAG: hypothetical protein A3E83_04945 [Gammaproteobacteria bacterium RIFCSPHIGHO2_12_FULL_41_20]|nr:MAG: hypothetical protein A3E83_04945 [Gammaproteobacteria bacterium RIFCSPHIGHO2_12_FULL_41_20]
MAEEGLQVVTLHDDFYRDGVRVVLAIVISLSVIILAMLGISIYLLFNKPQPMRFPVENDWRVVKPVPVEQSYLSITDLLQWVANSIPKTFNVSFVNYNADLTRSAQYFTGTGWKNFLNQINNYADYNSVQASKFFINSTLAGAPFILNQGLLQGRYAWWVQVPVEITYTSYEKTYTKSLVLQVLVVRVPTLDNLIGVGIENVLVNSSK